ncbi:MAG TPA: hypothetical protein VE684_20835, partial [Crenalkalicoccus sp.]|nr:hypothetical protein [Crenalkalicoccus sp.]
MLSRIVCMVLAVAGLAALGRAAAPAQQESGAAMVSLPQASASRIQPAAAAPGLALPPSRSLVQPAVLNAGAVPYLGAEGRADYARFLDQATPRAFAISPAGAWGWAAALETPAATAARALEICDRWGQPCRLYARD